MSIYQECSQAVRRLAKSPEVFTEIDVVNEASNQGWNKQNFKTALGYSQQIVSQFYRDGRLSRYGPVQFDGMSDYARIASKIGYAGAGPNEWATPNGTFGKLDYSSEPEELKKKGRRTGTTRDDTRPWTDQVIQAEKAASNGSSNGSIDTHPLMRRIEQLEAEARRTREYVETLEAENSRLSEIERTEHNQRLLDELNRYIEESIDEKVLDIVGEAEERVSSLERRLISALERFRGDTTQAAALLKR